MSNAIQLGPLLLPFTLLLAVASAVFTLVLGKLLSKSSEEVDGVLWQTMLAGLLTARLAFVFEFASLYLDSPLSILDIRDGGWNTTAGLIGAWLFALYRGRQSPAIRRPLRWALSAGTATLLIGTSVLSAGGGAGQQMPDLAFTSLQGERVQLRGFEGKPTVVNLWATWCPPCVREMPLLHTAQETRKDVHFVFLNQGEDVAHVAQWLQSRRLPLHNVLLDPRREAGAAFHQKGYPTTLFFNAQGELVSTRIGELSAATLKERLESLTP